VTFVSRHQAHEATVEKTVTARASRSHQRGGSGGPVEPTSSRRHLRGSQSRAASSNIDVFDDDDDNDDGEGGLVDLCDVDDQADVASYVYPSSKRSAAAAAVVSTGGARRYGRQHSAPPGVSSSSSAVTPGYDTVDTSRVQRGGGPRSADAGYEKVVTSCRYVHIWQMPLPKAPDE